MLKKKIFNDPVHGFITLSDPLLFELIEHPYMQRLRRIKQLGLCDYVYPGAIHTRFQHVIGAMHLMGIALQTLREKGNRISPQECLGAQVAILLHDLGHGPFSHALEGLIVGNVHHEKISQLLIKRLDAQLNHESLGIGMQIFEGSYPLKFLHQLVSGQLDVDRLDYLKRDCFYTGVTEGNIGAGRLLRMIDVRDNQLVIEEKGIYTVENILNARRMMYWQVYLHKTTLAAEFTLNSFVKRLTYLLKIGQIQPQNSVQNPFYFLLQQNNNNFELDLEKDPRILDAYTELDDNDVWYAIKQQARESDDFVLKKLAQSFLLRQLPRVRFIDKPLEDAALLKIHEQTAAYYKITIQEASYLVFSGQISNKAYISSDKSINILKKDETIVDVAKASDIPNITAMRNIVKKYYIGMPKEIDVNVDGL